MALGQDLRQTVSDQARHISELEAMGERMGIYIREWRARGERIAELEAENAGLREALEVEREAHAVSARERNRFASKAAVSAEDAEALRMGGDR